MRRLVLAFLVACLPSCGAAGYALSISRAATELERAEQLDAARSAPYEYYYAVEHLEKARTEAAQADYGDAIRLADAAHDFATRAVQRAQRVAPAYLPGQYLPGQR